VAAPCLDVALVHHPVVDRTGQVITATIDHFDVFDASRLSLTYPIGTVFVVNPEPSQRALAERLIKHGTDAHRAEDRRGVMHKTTWVPDLQGAIEAIRARDGRRPRVIATSARPQPNAIGFAELRAELSRGEPHLLLVGKASGLAQEALDGADLRLCPIDAGTGYNHLSVRSALAIMIDRLLAP
jgi:tRNA (guanine37-N1)-methyltransferase